MPDDVIESIAMLRVHRGDQLRIERRLARLEETVTQLALKMQAMEQRRATARKRRRRR